MTISSEIDDIPWREGRGRVGAGDDVAEAGDPFPGSLSPRVD